MSWLHVERIFEDGWSESWSLEWPGWTVDATRKHWRDRAKAAHWEHCWDGDVLVVTEGAAAESAGVVVVCRSFHDSCPDDHPAQDALIGETP